MELGYDGNAATAIPVERPEPERPAKETVEAPKPKQEQQQQEHQQQRQRQAFWKKAKREAKPVAVTAFAPKAVAGILVVAVVVMMMLISHAQLVMVNDQAVSLRSELSQLQSEGTKLKVKYELTYDLQEIETQMLTSGQMTKIQNWQTYVLELSEPDQVEYYQSHGGLAERTLNAARNFASAVKEYF